MDEDDDCVVVDEIICQKSSTDIALLPSKEDMSRVLECPVCYEIPFGPIVMCSSGHSLCRECKQKMDNCPVCQSNFTDVRCLVLESIVSMMKFDCPYKSQGCEESLPAGGRFNMHTQDCDYRAITCNESKGVKCSDVEVPFSDYIIHLQKNHVVTTIPVNAIITQSIIPPIRSWRDWSHNCFFVDSIPFLQKCRITNNSIYWWICVHSSKWTAEQYTASLFLDRNITPALPTAHHSLQNEKITWRIPVLSTRDCVNEKSPSVAAYPLKDLLKLSDLAVDEHGKKKYTWQLQITIQKKAKRDDKSTTAVVDITGDDPIITPPKARRQSTRRIAKRSYCEFFDNKTV